MKPVTICLTHWSRYPERVEYLRDTLESLNQQFEGRDWDQFVGQRFVSCESEGVAIDVRHDVTRLCRHYGFDAKWRDGYADIGDNQNDMVMQADCPLLFVNQDDVKMTRPFRLAPDVAMLESKEADLIRYSWFAPEPESITRSTTCEGEEYHFLNPGFSHLQPVVWYYYHDMPFLARRTFFNTVGPFVHNGRTQGYGVAEVNYDMRSRRADVLVAGRGGSHRGLWRYYTHIGQKSSMTEKWAIHWTKTGKKGWVT